MQTVLEQGSINKPLTFDVGLIQLSFIPVCSLNTCNISVKLCGGFALQCFSLVIEVVLLAVYCISYLPVYHKYCISSKRHRSYYLFQLYRNAATIRGRLLFEVQMSRLLFISALPQCGDYSRAATIRSTDVAATIYFSSTAVRQLFEGGYYSKYRCRGYYLFQLYRNAATIRGRLLFEVQMSRLLFISALPQCGDYSRAATIRSTDVAATIYFSSTAMRRLFEGGYYSKYRRHGYYLFQRYRNAATIRGRLLFKVRRLFEEIWYNYISVNTQFKKLQLTLKHAKFAKTLIFHSTFISQYTVLCTNQIMYLPMKI